MRSIKLMAEYQCWPLWEASPGVVGNVNPDTLPISFQLKEDLHKWAADFDRTLNEEYPPDSKFETMEEETQFKATGRALALRLKHELGDGFEVVAHRALSE